MIWVKKRVDSGAVCEQFVYSVPDNANVRTYKKRIRFATPEAYEQYKDQQARKRFARMINANYDPSSLKGTLTFDTENEVHDFEDARRVLRSYVRRIRRKCPDAKIILVMGRGLSTARIHLHYIMAGVPESVIHGAWTWGSIKETKHLRRNNKYNGVDHGQDYTALANYYWDHWTPEQGGHHYYATRNHVKPDEEEPREVKRVYSVEKPPRAPKGYKLVEATGNTFGYLYFKYTRIMS